MLFVISPAKALDYETPPHVKTHTQPLFVPQASELIDVLKAKSSPTAHREAETAKAHRG